MKIVIDSHTHSVASGHAYSTIIENFQYASSCNLQGVALTDHSCTMPGAPQIFYFSNLHVLPEYLSGVRFYKGVELNILDTDGNVDDFRSKETSVSPFDIFEIKIASMHLPCFKPSNAESHTRAIINTIKNNKIDVLGHLGDSRYPFNIDEVVKFAKESNVAIEMNNSSLIVGSFRYDEAFCCRILESCIKYDAPMTFGSDAHFAHNIGNFDNIDALFNKYGLGYDFVIGTSIEKFENFLKQNR